MIINDYPITKFSESKSSHHPKEYRIEERDCKSTPKLTIPNGTIVTFDKYVHRVGYALDPYSYTREEWYKAGLELLCYSTQLDEQTVGKVLKTLNLYHPFKGMRGRIYSKLVEQKMTDRQRSMWFVNYQDYAQGQFFLDLIQGTVVGRCRKWTGVHHPSTGGAGYDYDNYIPAYLDPAYNQNLYVVHNEDLGRDFMVHPLDIKEIDNV